MLTSSSSCLSLLHRALPPIGQRWFEYNDTSVQPIDSKEIDKMFQGKKSAYMLFYRRKTLDRPAGGGTRGNVLNNIWSRLLDPLARCCSNGRCISCERGSSVDHAIPIGSMSIVCCHVNRRVSYHSACHCAHFVLPLLQLWATPPTGSHLSFWQLQERRMPGWRKRGEGEGVVRGLVCTLVYKSRY